MVLLHHSLQLWIGPCQLMTEGFSATTDLFVSEAECRVTGGPRLYALIALVEISKASSRQSGIVVGEEVEKLDGFVFTIASWRFWGRRHMGMLLLFVWLWMSPVLSCSPIFYNPDHIQCFQTTWGIVQKLFVVQITAITAVSCEASATL